MFVCLSTDSIVVSGVCMYVCVSYTCSTDSIVVSGVCMYVCVS